MDNFSITSSALNAYQTSLNVNAHNIANANTQGFKAQSATFSTLDAGQGVAISEKANEMQAITNVEPSLEQSNTNLTKEAVNMKVQEQMYTANAKVLKTQDEMLGSLFDAFV